MLIKNVLVALAFALFTTGVAVGAEGKGPCAADAKKFCSNVQPGEGRIHKCMTSHQAELTPACRDGMEKFDRFAKACKSDWEKYCKRIPAGDGRILPEKLAVANARGPSGGCAPAAGDRFPWLQLKLRANGPVEDLFQMLDDTRYNLIVIGQPAPSGEAPGLADLLSIQVIPDDPHNTQELARVRIAGPIFYLLRPDGHVGLAGLRLEPDAVARYLSRSHIRIQK